MPEITLLGIPVEVLTEVEVNKIFMHPLTWQKIKSAASIYGETHFSRNEKPLDAVGKTEGKGNVRRI